ncbi:MAG: discoidin domain-containing protein [Bacteroidota bacterium]
MTRIIILTLFCVLSLCQLQAQCGDPDASIWNDTWQSCQASKSPNPARGQGHWIQYDFGQTYQLSKAHIWNTNEIGKMAMGFRNVIVDYSQDGSDWKELGQYEWAKGTGQATYGGFEGFDFEGATARFVLITAIDNWGDQECFGLAEVKFNIWPSTRDTGNCHSPTCLNNCPDVVEATVFPLSPNRVLLQWEEVDEVAYYQVRYRSTAGVWKEMVTEELVLELYDLQEDQNYEIEIRAYCFVGSVGNAAALSHKTSRLQQNCAPPVNSGYRVLEEEEALFFWNEVPGAEGYQLRYRRQESNDPWETVEISETKYLLGLEDDEEDFEYQLSVLCMDEWSEWGPLSFTDDGLVVTSVREELLSGTFDFSIVPNPARVRTDLLIHSDRVETVQIQVTDVLGRVVHRRVQDLQMGEQRLPIDLASLEAGVYIVSLRGKKNEEAQSKRLVLIDD